MKFFGRVAHAVLLEWYLWKKVMAAYTDGFATCDHFGLTPYRHQGVCVSSCLTAHQHNTGYSVPLMCYRAEFGDSRSNSVRIGVA